MTAGELGLYWRTARHMRFGQAGHWLRRRVMRPARRAIAAGRGSVSVSSPGNAELSLRLPSSTPKFPEWQPARARRMILAREFQFLNRRFAGSKEIPWSGSGFGRLWDYHLHYFDYINLDLTSPEDEPLLLSALTVVLNWIDSNPRGQPPGWEPYPLSLRIVNWLKFLDRHAKRLWEIERASDTAKIVASLSAQVCALEGGLEKDVLTNHLLKNAKALVFAGGLLQTAGSHRWLREGLEPLKREIQEQILEDGGHFQRSPMYHGQVLEDLLDLEILLTSWPLPAAGAESESGGEVAQLLRERVVKMSGWLQAMLHPDDEIPLMNDSALGMVSPPRELLERVGMMRTARARGHNAPDAASNVPASSGHSDVRILDQSGYATIRHEPVRSFLVFDCGPLGPSYQPGHGHCDLLSFELSLHGMRVVVDTGTSTYEAGPIRSHERSTAAHNTLRIDGEEQAEMWSSFRVGRRPQVGRLTGAAHGNLSFVQGKYSTGARCGVMHARAVIRDGEGGWWFVDLLEGSGEHGVESFIHFHPQVTVELVRQVNAAQAPPCNFREQAILDFGGHRYRLLGPTGTAFKLAESWYSPEFGMRVKNTVASWRWRGRIPAASAFALAPMESRIPEVRLSAERGCCWIGDFKLSLR